MNLLANVVNDYKLHKLKKILNKINHLAPKMSNLSDNQLKDMTIKFRKSLAEGVDLKDLLVEAYAVVREADKRVLGLYPYDVQVLGAIALSQGTIIEMKTGEGKTLTATMPLYLNGLTSKGAMLVTPNDYLAERDGTEMGQVYKWLGLSCSIGFETKKQPKLDTKKKRTIYNSDIIYTTNSTIGFDYLFDNLAASAKDKYMRDFNYAIVDEADQVLLDDAITPLIISGAPKVTSTFIQPSDEFIYTLRKKHDFKFDDEHNNVWFTKHGRKELNHFFNINNVYDGDHTELVRTATLALKAHELFEKDKNYVVTPDKKIALLDKANGRVLKGMKIQAGQHQAIEMKEQVDVTSDDRAMAMITYQNLFHKFKKLSGMTGTALAAKREFMETYNVETIQIPTNKPVIRIDKPDKVYPTLPEKLMASLRLVKKLHNQGRPVLIATANVNLSEVYSELLLKEKIPHSVLNAKNVAKEAEMVKEAGQYGAVTVATNMAGRGTDIKLGKGVAELGGLAIVGTEKMPSKRIDQQLRGRAGRQGQPGTSQFFISLEDEVVTKHGAKWLQDYYEKHKNDLDLENPRQLKRKKFIKAITQAQRQSDDMNAASRKQAMDMDESVQLQRKLVYDQRNDLIYDKGKPVSIDKILLDEFNNFYTNHPKLNANTLQRYILDNITYDYFDNPDNIALNKRKVVVSYLMDLAKKELAKKDKLFDNIEEKKRFQRVSMLKAIDESWISEVDSLEQLRQVISSRAVAQRDSTYEYHKESLKSYKKMKQDIKHKITRNLLLSTILIGKNGKKDIYFV